MKKITQSALKHTIKLHTIWLKDPHNADGQQANLSDVDLSYKVLKNVNLSQAILNNTNFYGTTLSNVCLSRAILKNTNFMYASLENCNLANADLTGANLELTVLYKCDLSNAILRGAQLYGSKLNNTSLYFAHLEHTDFTKVILIKVNLYTPYLTGAKLIETDLSKIDIINTNFYYTHLIDTIFPEKNHYRVGKILTKPIKGYNKCNKGKDIVTFEIPKGAIVFGTDNIHLRTNKAKIVAISGCKKEASVYNEDYKNAVYKLSKTYIINNFHLQYNRRYANGIAFYKTKKDLKMYT